MSTDFQLQETAPRFELFHRLDESDLRLSVHRQPRLQRRSRSSECFRWSLPYGILRPFISEIPYVEVGTPEWRCTGMGLGADAAYGDQAVATDRIVCQPTLRLRIELFTLNRD